MSGSSMRDFQILQKLGEGSFSVVYKVRRTQDQIDYALKKVKLPQLKEKEKQNALNEVRLLASLDDQYIVAYKDAFIDDQTSSLCIVMELLSGGDLQKRITQVLRNSYQQFTENDIWRALVHMTRGLKSLHDANVVHRDLKCANVFLSQDGKFKLGDLNVSKVAKMGLVYTQTGTPYYASPEVWRDEPYDSKSDIWSLGCVLYEMATLKPPFRANDMDGLFKKVQKGVYDPLPARFSKDLAEVIASMLRVKSNQRPSCDQILSNTLVIKHGHESLDEPTDQKAQLLKTIQLPKNVRNLKEKLPKSKYTNERDSFINKSVDRLDRESTQQGDRYVTKTPERPNRYIQESPKNKITSNVSSVTQSVQITSNQPQPPLSNAPSTNIVPSQQNSRIVAYPPPANNNQTHATSHVHSQYSSNVPQSAYDSKRPNHSPLLKNPIANQRPHSYNPVNHQAQYRDRSPKNQLLTRPTPQPEPSRPNKPLSAQIEVRSNPHLVGSKPEPRGIAKVESSYLQKHLPQGYNEPQTEQIKRKEPNVFPQQARVQSKKQPTESSPYLSNPSKAIAAGAAGKPTRPLSSNIVPDHQLNARQRQLVDHKPQFNIITNVPYNHYYPVADLRSQLSDPTLHKQRQQAIIQPPIQRNPVYMSNDPRGKPLYKLSEVQKYQSRRVA